MVRFMVCNSAPSVALFWCHFQRWIIKEKNGSTLQRGTVFQNMLYYCDVVAFELAEVLEYSFFLCEPIHLTRNANIVIM